MKRALWTTLALAGVWALAGCDSKWGVDSGAQRTSSALPAVFRPVGPLPGPGDGPPQGTNPLGHDPQALRDGRQLFVRFNCSGCHGGRGGGGMGPSLRDVVWMYGGKDMDIFDSIAEGRANGMPAWGTKLNQEQIWRLVAYIDSMGTDHEPEAPQ
ncbi:c-type cytochrome [Azohydromonas australica]|uniref:c-type cytochrome n=1 Tax=Azohydromonas australica TaxID=364039 RepID=UPI0004028884|nr:c-type cytochrome [Azohydromonas australica]